MDELIDELSKDDYNRVILNFLEQEEDLITNRERPLKPRAVIVGIAAYFYLCMFASKRKNPTLVDMEFLKDRLLIERVSGSHCDMDIYLIDQEDKNYLKVVTDPVSAFLLLQSPVDEIAVDNKE